MAVAVLEWRARLEMRWGVKARGPPYPRKCSSSLITTSGVAFKIYHALAPSKKPPRKLANDVSRGSFLPAVRMLVASSVDHNLRSVPTIRRVGFSDSGLRRDEEFSAFLKLPWTVGLLGISCLLQWNRLRFCGETFDRLNNNSIFSITVNIFLDVKFEPISHSVRQTSPSLNCTKLVTIWWKKSAKQIPRGNSVTNKSTSRHHPTLPSTKLPMVQLTHQNKGS